MTATAKAIAATVTGHWLRQSPRERRLLSGLAVFLLAVLAFSVLWQPAQQRLVQAERNYQQQRLLAVQVQQAQPARAGGVAHQPLSVQASESAVAAGLELHQLDVEGDLLRMTVTGDALAVLLWLDQVEQQGGQLQSLLLNKVEKRLQARLVLQSAEYGRSGLGPR
ncbi:type II secretion system protein M [Pseudomonas sp. GD03860]|uniref:type II secretion system protein GspM n=1 Tax=Pseudomonas TaxID=286 RepID=UPI00236366F6|nr:MULTISPECIES: type II secretion system protein GspM [Pseudomonas]MDD2058604.1 type II secretion system protein M [Pseudomonas putida]MDH0640793.1 type II secretion system protein M [Pseudomonas sp. GD03860]